jgi:hypothetical protein
MLRTKIRMQFYRIARQSVVLISGIVLVLCWIDSIPSRVIDPDSLSPERPILALIADYLDRYDIDTVYGKSTDYPLPEGSVRVAPLGGFTPRERDWGEYWAVSWAYAFQEGVLGVIIAVPKAIEKAEISCIEDILKLGNDVCDFVRKWVSTPREQRIFIAFTKNDFDHARRVAQGLEDAGFTVFLFLKGHDQKPWADPAMVGEVFAQAGFRIVIDSANSRGSPGVALERGCEDLLRSPPPTTSLVRALQTQPSSNRPAPAR